MRISSLLSVACVLFCASFIFLVQPAPATEGTVVTVHPLATDAGLAALERGGTAVDAAVAAALTLGVVDSHNSGIGGGCFILIRRADGKLAAIDGRETAGARATADMYLRDGKPQPELSKTGPLAVGVPGALAAYDRALREHGRLRLAELLLPAAKIAADGYRLDAGGAARLNGMARHLARFPGSRAVFVRPDRPWRQGELFRQDDLARTYRAIAARGTGWFYKGPFAERVGNWMAKNGGILTAEDFARYQARKRQPVVTTYCGLTIVGFPPPSSGGVHVAQILNILEHFDLRKLYRDEPAAFYHVVAEAMKPAFADRAHWLGDSDYAKVPRGLIDKQYAAELARRIDPGRTIKVEKHGLPPGRRTDHFGRHTMHLAAADREGNWVAITATINTAFGSKVIVPGTGVVLNNQMDDFSIAPGVPNTFGLVGAEANAVAPGKRPLSSMSPTIVLRDGRPVLTLGAAGGPTIITQVVMTLLYHLDLGRPLPEAVASPRIHHQWLPDGLRVQKSLGEEIIQGLKKRGHKIKQVSHIGITQAIGVTRDGRLIGVHDPNVRGKAAGT
jgi:gamma-glutamyltranspeptidase/glutathione hydrolase